MTDRALLQQALEALEPYETLHSCIQQVITALRERLAQPVQDDGANTITFKRNAQDGTAEMLRLDSKGFHYNGQVIEDAGEAHRLFMQWLAIANAEQPEHEPVACQHKRYTVDEHEQTGRCFDCGAEGRMRFIVDKSLAQQPEQEPVRREQRMYMDEQEFYTAPPKRKPLTDEEIADVANSVRWSQQYHLDFARAIEAKLREKNGGGV